MKISPLLIPFVIEDWCNDPELNSEGRTLKEMLLVHVPQLDRLELPDNDVIALEAGAMKLLQSKQST